MTKNNRSHWRFIVLVGQALILMMMLAACSTSTYSLGEYKLTRMGNSTLDKEALAGVKRVALVAFHGKNSAPTSVRVLERLIDLAYQQALTSISEQSTLEFIPVEQILASTEYIQARSTLDPEVYYSPVKGLTDLSDDQQKMSISTLCEELQVDALLIYRIQFDWEFPTWNVVTMKTLLDVELIVPPDAHVVWQTKEIKWNETQVYTPDNFKLLLVGNPNAEEWDTIINTCAEIPESRAVGGAPLYFLGEEAAQIR